MAGQQGPHQEKEELGHLGQGILSAFSLTGACAAASLPLEGFPGMHRGKNTLLHRHTLGKESCWCLVRLLGTTCLNGGVMQHLSPWLVMPSTFSSLFCVFKPAVLWGTMAAPSRLSLEGRYMARRPAQIPASSSQPAYITVLGSPSAPASWLWPEKNKIGKGASGSRGTIQ